MEQLSKSLQPYKGLVGQVASIVTIAQFFSGAFICKDIYNKQSSRGISVVPFLGGVVVGLLNLKYAEIVDDAAMRQVNQAAILLNLIYLAVFYVYTEDKMQSIYKPAGYGVALVAVFLGYANIEKTENLEFRYGLLVTILMLLLLGSPLIDVKEIIAKKDASSIPFPLTLMGTIVSFLWFLYGIILLNYFMIVQNIIGFSLCLLQLVLIFIYPGDQSEGSRQKKKKPVKKD